MSKRRIFTIESELSFGCCFVRVEIDLSRMTPETAAEVNGFWLDGENVLEKASGDPIRAVALRAAAFFLKPLIHNCAEESMQSIQASLGEAEGWPRNHGVTLLDFNVPAIDVQSLQVVEDYQ